jgi:putative ABC transport system permease protein
VASFWLTRLLGTMLYGVDARDPMSFAVGATLVVAVAVLASAVPAVRASRVPPAVVLRD